AIILSFFVRMEAFISGTTKGLSKSMRHAEELSITVVPAAANFGAHSNEVEPPAENKAISGDFESASSIPQTGYSLFLNTIGFPTELTEATGINSETGKFLSAKTASI